MTPFLASSGLEKSFKKYIGRLTGNIRNATPGNPAAKGAEHLKVSSVRTIFGRWVLFLLKGCPYAGYRGRTWPA
jgi:hypothetical protein